MTEVLPSWPILAGFLAASLLLAISPGPGVVYIVTRSVTQGRRSGLASVAGVALGNLGAALGATLGLGAVLAVSSSAFLVVKYAGAVYLIYLGVQALRRPSAEASGVPLEVGNSWRIFREGCVVALLNPKTIVFFGAFLPQFMSADAAPVLQSIMLGALFVGIAAVTDTAYALAGAYAAPLLLRAQSVRSIGRYLTGGAFIGLGVFAALSNAKPQPR
jgi:threonine/homoserine/homoserine lactone efflux protein